MKMRTYYISSEKIKEGLCLHNHYYLMNFCAALFAAFGALLDHEPVIVGSMIIAMLYNPIVVASWGIVKRNKKWFVRAMMNLSIGLVLVYSVGMVIGFFYQDIPTSASMIKRTSFTSIDLIVAFFCGVAGTYSLLISELHLAIVGIGIVVSLVPPTVVSALFLMRGELVFAQGALMLTGVNVLGIFLGAVATLFLIKTVGFKKQ